jgi:integrase
VTPYDVLSILPAGNKPNGQPYAPATRHRVFEVLSRLFNWSIKMGLYSGENPCRPAKPPRYDNQRQRYLTDQEREALLAALSVESDQFAARAIRFLMWTGRRRGEVLAMEWTDVDMDRGFVTFRHTKNGKVQTVPVNSKAMDVLRSCPRISDLVFPCSTGRHLYLWRQWDRIRARAGLTGLRCHDLRHAFASTLASSGRVDIYTLQRLLGHSQITMTQRYAHLMPGALRDAAEVACL